MPTPKRQRLIYAADSFATGANWGGSSISEFQAGLLVRPQSWGTSTQPFGDSLLKALVLSTGERAELIVSAFLTPPARYAVGIIEATYTAILANASRTLDSTNTTFPGAAIQSQIFDKFFIVNNTANPLYLHARTGPSDTTGYQISPGGTSDILPIGYDAREWQITGASNAVAAAGFTVFFLGQQRKFSQVLGANLYVIPPQVVSSGQVIPNIASTALIAIPMRSTYIPGPSYSHWLPQQYTSFGETDLESTVKFGLDRPLRLPVNHGLALAVDFMDEGGGSAAANVSTVFWSLTGVATYQGRT